MTINTETQAPQGHIGPDKIAQTPATPPPSPEPQKKTETAEDPNWKAFREARKKDRADKEAAEKRATEKEAEANALKAAMEAAFSKSSQSQSQSQSQAAYDQPEESEDQRIEKKVQAALAARDAEHERTRQQREAQEFPQKLKVTYPDIEHVLTQENIDWLDYHFPEVTGPLRDLPEGYNKYAHLYKAAKKFIPNVKEAQRESEKATQNYAKPKSISSTGIMQPGEAKSPYILTEEKRAQNWAAMQARMGKGGIG